MLENDKILLILVNELEAMQNQLTRISRENYSIHRLDVELMQNQIRAMYDQLLKLEENIDKKPEVVEKIQTPFIPVQEKEVMKEKKEVVVEEKVETTNFEVEIPEPEKTDLPEPEPLIEEEKEIISKAETVEYHFTEVKPAPTIEEIKRPENQSVRSTIDLFTSTSEKSISDKFFHDNEPSIADKMRQTRVSDLRQAIGINEKFLFINELFNGDLGKYNKALDELNEMKTKEGLHTFFIELKIHNQWNEENAAFIKLCEILDRKFE